MVPKRLPREFRTTCRSRVRRPSVVADDLGMNNSLNITENVAFTENVAAGNSAQVQKENNVVASNQVQKKNKEKGQVNQKKKKGKVLGMVEIPNPQTALSILDVERCARLRAIKQSRLDQMETANWGSLLQAISERSDGNACD
ncbi:hypothetical protein SLEP1_g20005 [Rubroshorea leprosula]|nr:hypothetical protein SLEP1_g20005 [Rubroshorea leprosula]